jgi:hypothetical protein
LTLAVSEYSTERAGFLTKNSNEEEDKSATTLRTGIKMAAADTSDIP